MHKKPEIVIHPSELPLFLLSKMGETSIDDFAKQLGVTSQMVRMMLNGERRPGRALRAKLGIELFYGVVKE